MVAVKRIPIVKMQDNFKYHKTIEHETGESGF